MIFLECVKFFEDKRSENVTNMSKGNKRWRFDVKNFFAEGGIEEFEWFLLSHKVKKNCNPHIPSKIEFLLWGKGL